LDYNNWADASDTKSTATVNKMTRMTRQTDFKSGVQAILIGSPPYFVLGYMSRDIIIGLTDQGSMTILIMRNLESSGVVWGCGLFFVYYYRL